MREGVGHKMASFTIELEEIAEVRRGINNPGFTHEDSHNHLKIPSPQYGVSSRNNNDNPRGSLFEEEIPDLDESGFQPFRQHLVCPYCKRSIITDVHLRNGKRVWMTFFMFVLTGFCLVVPLFFCYIAFLMDWLKDVYHYCPKCKNRLGKYVRK